MDSRTKARRGLAIFFVVLIAGTAYFEGKIFVLSGDIGRHLSLIYALMWWVTVASVVARLIMRESPRDVSFRWVDGLAPALSWLRLPSRSSLDSWPTASRGARGWRNSIRRIRHTRFSALAWAVRR